MLGCILTLAGGYLVAVDRVEGDRVVVEWCDRSTSDLPGAMFPPDVREGAVLTLFLAGPTPAEALPGPGPDGADLHPAGRTAGVAPNHRGPARTEIEP